jgi:hypothetical protein
MKTASLRLLEVLAVHVNAGAGMPPPGPPSVGVPAGECPPFDHYDFLLPCEQIIGLLLENSLDVET